MSPFEPPTAYGGCTLEPVIGVAISRSIGWLEVASVPAGHDGPLSTQRSLWQFSECSTGQPWNGVRAS